MYQIRVKIGLKSNTHLSYAFVSPEKFSLWSRNIMETRANNPNAYFVTSSIAVVLSEIEFIALEEENWVEEEKDEATE